MIDLFRQVHVRKRPVPGPRLVYNPDMTLEPEICYRAVSSRDARFDGRFFSGVTSTGIYCRPICPARTPKRRNLRYYRCAAEAAEAGFRPCLRCRPESAPGTPAWSGNSTTVARALRLIQQGSLGEAGIDGLADRLGVGARHLRRLFAERLGVSPMAVELTRRVQFAIKLLDETALPITQIAMLSGFRSVRRFNAAIQKACRRPPRELRREGARRIAGERIELKLSYRLPFDFDGLIGFLKLRAIPGVEQVRGDCYRRTVRLAGTDGTIDVCRVDDRPALRLSVPIRLAVQLPEIVARVRGLLDLDADPACIDKLLGRDATLRTLVRRRPGLRVPGCWDRFELAVRAILGQQVTVKGARTLAARLVERYGEPLSEPADGLNRLFPTADRLANLRATSVGVPETRAGAIRALARAVRDSQLDLDDVLELESAVERIRELPGVGEWTAQYIAMRALGEPDAFPGSDLAVRRALTHGSELPSAAETARCAERWRPWRSYATMHLWLGDTRQAKGRKR